MVSAIKGRGQSLGKAGTAGAGLNWAVEKMRLRERLEARAVAMQVPGGRDGRSQSSDPP